MTTQQGIKQYRHVPFLAPFTCCIDPILNPLIGTLDYCVVKYAIDEFIFGGRKLAFQGDYCSYNCVLCKSSCGACLTCGVWYFCFGGNHIMPTYLDEHVCWADEEKTFKPGTRYEDAGRCKNHFEQVRETVLSNKKDAFLDHMYIMQNTPAMPFCDMCKNFCSCDFGTKQMLAIENQLRYTRIGGQQMKFLGSADGFNATQPSCGYMCHHCPCWCFHRCIMGTYKDALFQYTDNNLAWVTKEEVPVEEEFSIGDHIPSMGDAKASVSNAITAGKNAIGSLFGSDNASKVVPEPAETGTAPGAK